MTAAGVATLFITQDYVGPGQSAKCVGNVTSPSSKAIDKGLAYMAAHLADWTPENAHFGLPATEWYPCYTLYGVERIGVASGLKYIGTTDWYEYGADWCVKHQARDGSWNRPADTDNTALALLFLARGRAPILVNKVQYDDATGPNAGQPGHWDERPRDVANVVRWAGRQAERDLNWQVTNLKVPEADLHDAPFLYLSGNQALRLSADAKQKLKRFCESGGTILFNADCGGATGTAGATAQNPFVTSVVGLARELFPDDEFRDLPASSPVYQEQFLPSRWKRPPTIRALSNGVRELMFLLPDDPARAWQLRQTLGAGNEEAFQAFQDIILYGTDKQPLRVKGIPFLVTPDEAVKATRTITVGRAKYAGNWDPEPGGWRRLAAVLHNRAKVDLDVKTIALGHGELKPGSVQVLDLTGTTPLHLPAAQQAELKAFVQGRRHARGRRRRRVGRLRPIGRVADRDPVPQAALATRPADRPGVQAARPQVPGPLPPLRPDHARPSDRAPDPRRADRRPPGHLLQPGGPGRRSRRRGRRRHSRLLARLGHRHHGGHPSDRGQVAEPAGVGQADPNAASPRPARFSGRGCPRG